MAIDCSALYLQSLRLRGGCFLLTTQGELYPMHSDVFLVASSLHAMGPEPVKAFLLRVVLTYLSTKRKRPSTMKCNEFQDA